MIAGIKKIFSIHELRTKIFFTFIMLAICRIGASIPVPGINIEAAEAVFRKATGGGQNLFQLMDMFSGGAFARMTVVALGVMPYISASIIMQLLVAVVPSLQREIKENASLGRKKVAKWTRLLTIGLAFFQSWIFARYAFRINESTPGIIVGQIADVKIFNVPWLFYLTMVLTMSTGTIFLMWIGEQISDKGIGNGISLIITIGILSSFPSMIGSIINQLNLESQEVGELTISSILILLVVFVLIIIGTILVIQGQRKIPIQYARRGIVREGSVEGGSSYIPLKINYAGVIPVIFASSFLMFPATIAQWLGRNSFIGRFVNYLTPGSIFYTLLYVSLILFFTFFWTSTQFHPEQIASDMKKNGAFIPGIRQGKPTQDFLESTMGKITLIGGVFLSIIAILPVLVSKILGIDQRVSYFFGGTSLLILVGVILDTYKQIESHLIMRRYQGFMKKRGF
ncbi:MAG: preprotein translocase subunit SecY [Chlamydiae bacterium SM23_39]|nr:MAG: preprotein translocase subunit SecY [Chlamydiae bacterium SM23_39]